jgi:NTE family protein
VAGHLDALEEWLRTLDRKAVASFFDVSLTSGGLIAGKRLMNFFKDRFGDYTIESLPVCYAAVATELTTGHEVWFRSGSLLEAVRASISLPGLFEPIKINDKWFVDGGITNPIPVSVCRSMGADIVIAVNLQDTPLGQPLPIHQTKKLNAIKANDVDTSPAKLTQRIQNSFKASVNMILSQIWRGNKNKPGLFYVMSNAAHFMQYRITLSRLACDPPDLIITPRLGYIGLLEFHRAAELVEKGKIIARQAEIDIIELLNTY